MKGDILKNIPKNREGNKLELAIPKYNIRETKQSYSDINNYVLKGFEAITYKGGSKTPNEDEEVSHIKKKYLDHLLDILNFNPITEKDEELGVYTISINEINMYGEGTSIEEATDDLLDSVLEYLKIWVEKAEIFTKVESIDKQLYMLKLLRYSGDKSIIRKTIGV